jgi:cell division protein FtsB
MQKINIRKFYYRLTHDYLTLNNLVVVIAFAIAASWVWGSIGVMQRNYRLQQDLDAKTQQLKLTELETLSAQLEQKYYQSDEYKELAVRTRLGLANPGERVIILPPNSQAAKAGDQAASASQQVAAVAPGNFQQWVNFLFGGNSKSLQK